MAGVGDPFARFRPPAPGAVAPALTVPHAPTTPADLQAMTLLQLEHEILALIAAAEGRTVAELSADPQHTDGTLAIDSQLAVFALARIGGIVGRPKLVDLSAVDTDDLHSVAGVARLARTALGPITIALFGGDE